MTNDPDPNIDPFLHRPRVSARLPDIDLDGPDFDINAIGAFEFSTVKIPGELVDSPDLEQAMEDHYRIEERTHGVFCLALCIEYGERRIRLIRS